MYTAINGWTKESMIAHVKKEFTGKSTMPGSTLCFYRSPESPSKKCAVGMFIPDSEYKESMERGSLLTLIRDYPFMLTLMPLAYDGLLGMQLSHDESDPNETLTKILEFIDQNVVDSTESVA